MAATSVGLPFVVLLMALSMFAFGGQGKLLAGMLVLVMLGMLFFAVGARRAEVRAARPVPQVEAVVPELE